MMSKRKRKELLTAFIIILIAVITCAIAVCVWLNKKIDSQIEIEQLNEHIWLMNENDEATGYVVVGENKAAVIDTMNGYSDLKSVVSEITNLPIIVINTHGHSDHIFGDAFFDEVYINPVDKPLAQSQFCNMLYPVIERKFNHDPVKFLDTKAGDTFDLGKIVLEVFEVPGHTQGSICLLDREDRVLFTGDSINRHLWMQLYGSTSMSECYDSLQKLSSIRGEYDYICHGHAKDFEDASLYEEMTEAIREVRDGETAEDSPYEYWGGTCTQHKYTKGDVVIVYNETK